MFDDLIDPDPPRPGLDMLATVYRVQRARRLRRRREATRVICLGAVAGLLVGSLAFVVDGDPDQAPEIAESLDAGEDAVIDISEPGRTRPPLPGNRDGRARSHGRSCRDDHDHLLRRRVPSVDTTTTIPVSDRTQSAT